MFDFKLHCFWTIAHIIADMKSYIPLETAAISSSEPFFLKQGISSENVMVYSICKGLIDLLGAPSITK